jgi:hypothetical protein
MALGLGVFERGRWDEERDSSSNWFVFSTTSTATVDLPEPGTPATPTNRRELEGILEVFIEKKGPELK